jgi:hypothetical protein
MFTLTWPLLVELVAGVSAGLILNLMPLIIPLSAARLVRQALRGRHPDERRPLFVAVVFSAFAIASVYYQPNSFHFAVVGPIWLSLFGELLERMVQRLEATLRVPWVAPALSATLLILLTLQLHRAYDSAWATGVPVDTAFGRVHLRSQALADEFTVLRSTLQAAGAKDVLVYPAQPALYLMTQTSNPTPFRSSFLVTPRRRSSSRFRRRSIASACHSSSAPSGSGSTPKIRCARISRNTTNTYGCSARPGRSPA